MYQLKLSKEVDKFLDKHRDIWKRLDEKMPQIQENPHHPVWVDIKPYIWYPNNYRLRIGKYRFLYEVIDDEILVYFYDADSRGDIYR
jgi:mRNA interferase RelE/StbE